MNTLRLLSLPSSLSLSPLDQWNVDFVKFLLDNIEDPPDSDTEDELPDVFLNVILSFNQHFECKQIIFGINLIKI